jgi:putative methionine-R-sulfoxide reductase with GAF domain
MKRDATGDLLGTTAASQYLGVSRTTLHRLVESGALVPTQYTPSGYRRFSALELRRFQSMGHMRRHADMPDSEDVLSNTVRRQSVLLDLAESISGPHTVESMCMAAVTAARDALRSGDRAGVWLVHHDGQSLVPEANVGYSSRVDVSPFLIARDSITARALKTGQPVVCEDALLRPLEGSDLARIQSADLRAYIAVPMIGPNQVRGLLLLGCRHPTAFPAEDIVFLTRLTKLLAHSLETALHVEQYERVYDIVQSLSDHVGSRKSDRDLASLAASAVGCLSNADVVLVSVDGAASGHPPAWIGAWSPDGLCVDDLPVAPLTVLTTQLRSERRTIRVDDIHSYPGVTNETRELATVLAAPMWQAAPLIGPTGVMGAISVGFKVPTQLSQATLRSIAVIALHMGLALSRQSPERSA